MQEKFLNNGGDIVGGVADVGSKASKANVAVDIGKALGEIGIKAIDASKRRAMDYNFNQQKIQSELGLAKDAQEQQYQLQKLAILAQGSKPSGSAKSNTLLYVGVGVGVIAIGGLIYFIIKRK
jgi:hypothetical protein